MKIVAGSNGNGQQRFTHTRDLFFLLSAEKHLKHAGSVVVRLQKSGAHTPIHAIALLSKETPQLLQGPLFRLLFRVVGLQGRRHLETGEGNGLIRS